MVRRAPAEQQVDIPKCQGSGRITAYPEIGWSAVVNIKPLHDLRSNLLASTECCHLAMLSKSEITIFKEHRSARPIPKSSSMCRLLRGLKMNSTHRQSPTRHLRPQHVNLSFLFSMTLTAAQHHQTGTQRPPKDWFGIRASTPPGKSRCRLRPKAARILWAEARCSSVHSGVEAG